MTNLDMHTDPDFINVSEMDQDEKCALKAVWELLGLEQMACNIEDHINIDNVLEGAHSLDISHAGGEYKALTKELKRKCGNRGLCKNNGGKIKVRAPMGMDHIYLAWSAKAFIKAFTDLHGFSIAFDLYLEIKAQVFAHVQHVL
ncbi:hypothetical protein SERLA73DRAFT_149249 [Serpula lacrymans var. lacrymans S7.3]|uniref:Uncharacterized protein n=1 Tax=Serpula lacrymans var. lacrymans (strain S7.3) TaxID=936435 RepID=F8PH35_SERL3|nr:hypothetical protein SERLA73DRAFT_149249 [Serpula lacrymans var. lacrymans S7.3]